MHFAVRCSKARELGRKDTSCVGRLENALPHIPRPALPARHRSQHGSPGNVIKRRFSSAHCRVDGGGLQRKGIRRRAGKSAAGCTLSALRCSLFAVVRRAAAALEAGYTSEAAID
eukprot:364600-Chlamydomonas_euryale.AAC.7